MIRYGGRTNPNEKKPTFQKWLQWGRRGGHRSLLASLRGHPATGFPGFLSTEVALMSGSVSSRAECIESLESNSFHTYLMLVTVAETLYGVIELMRYLRKCIFFFTKKYHMTSEGEPLMGSFHTRKLSFFLY